MILGLDSSIKAVMIADRQGGLISHRLVAGVEEEPVISDERPLAVPLLKQGVVVFLRIAGECPPGRIQSAVEELLCSWPRPIDL